MTNIDPGNIDPILTNTGLTNNDQYRPIMTNTNKIMRGPCSNRSCPWKHRNVNTHVMSLRDEVTTLKSHSSVHSSQPVLGSVWDKLNCLSQQVEDLVIWFTVHVICDSMALTLRGSPRHACCCSMVVATSLIFLLCTHLNHSYISSAVSFSRTLSITRSVKRNV